MEEQAKRKTWTILGVSWKTIIIISVASSIIYILVGTSGLLTDPKGNIIVSPELDNLIVAFVLLSPVLTIVYLLLPLYLVRKFILKIERKKDKEARSQNLMTTKNDKAVRITPESILDNLSSGRDFEKMIAKLLVRKEFHKVDLTPHSNDYGADVIASKNRIKYVIQCKYWDSTVGNTSVQEVVAARDYYNAHVAIVATNNQFTNNAKKLAESNRVILWDRNELLRMIRDVMNQEDKTSRERTL